MGFLTDEQIVYSNHSMVVIATVIHLSCKQTEGSRKIRDNAFAWALCLLFRSFAIYFDPSCSHPAPSCKISWSLSESSHHKAIQSLCSKSLLAIYTFIYYINLNSIQNIHRQTYHTILQHLPHPSLTKDQAQLEWQWHQSAPTKIAVEAIFGSKALNEARNVGAA